MDYGTQAGASAQQIEENGAQHWLILHPIEVS